MSQLYLSLLGSPEIRHRKQEQDQVLKLPTRKVLALLIYLALEGGMHPREKLIALLWPDSDEAQGRTILRRTLALLREVLEETAVAPLETHLIVQRNALGVRQSSSLESDVYVLNAAFASIRARPIVDKLQGEERRALMTQVQEALQLVRGTFLEDFTLPDAPAFETWMSTQREAIRRRLNVLSDLLSTWQMEAGELTAAIATATRWVETDPSNEEAARRLMQLFFSIGKRDEALYVYETTRAWLRRELDVEPAPETLALAERLRREPLAPQRAQRQQVGALQLDGLLIGRAEEYASLVERYHRVQQEGLQLMLIEGEAGIGKTRLVTDFLGWASAQGADVLQGRAAVSVSNNRLPYQLLIDALRRRMERENAPEDLLSDIWLSELARILPELRERYPDLAVPVVDELVGQAQLFEAVARLGQAWAARRPLVIFFDDLQWTDMASRDLLTYVLQQWREKQLPILLIANVRTDLHSTQADWQEWLFHLKYALPTLTMPLAGLRFEDIARWVQYLEGRTARQEKEAPAGKVLATSITAAPFVHWLFSKTRGQPLYITEILRVLLEREMLRALPRSDGTWAIDTASITLSDIAQWQHVLPEKIHDIISMRLVRLSPTAKILLSAAAELCSDFTFELLYQVAELSSNDALLALDELISHRLLIEQIDSASEEEAVTYVFPHATLREVVYIETSESRRRVLHGRALDHLQDTGIPAAFLAYYAQGSGRSHQEVAHWYQKAGDEARQVFAIQQSRFYCEQARSLLAKAP
ncbi:hypothetical protein EPA93_09090 [Ktedonosporobacter rubrisoli]|uniref:Bacterial transcriptional activator domain-containing protein n=1 Tax=Ktedonosporobacter rubrisoli TaxID=2509675 RepID=A0A4P6JLR2_KTERU|nr:AAA family ATPase [Ktedonosporobacter rubrisoli]QBD76155.1 hypothetical protein EPA93_09090 [Ktedonosporobacter rubrisoli]